MAAYLQQQAIKKKTEQQWSELPKLHLITTSKELYQSIGDIDATDHENTASKKRELKLSLLRAQIK